MHGKYGYNRLLGGHGFGNKNDMGKAILDFAMVFYLARTNILRKMNILWHLRVALIGHKQITSYAKTIKVIPGETFLSVVNSQNWTSNKWSIAWEDTWKTFKEWKHFEKT